MNANIGKLNNCNQWAVSRDIHSPPLSPKALGACQARHGGELNEYSNVIQHRTRTPCGMATTNGIRVGAIAHPGPPSPLTLDDKALPWSLLRVFGAAQPSSPRAGLSSYEKYVELESALRERAAGKKVRHAVAKSGRGEKGGIACERPRASRNRN